MIHDDVIKWNIFRVIGPLWEQSTGRFHSLRPVTRSFDVFFDLRLNKRCKQTIETPMMRRHRAQYDATVMCLLTTIIRIMDLR